MINTFFLDCLHVNDDAKSPNNTDIVRGVDDKETSGYNAKGVARQLEKLSTAQNVAQRVFYSRLVVAYLFQDVGFDNTSWGYDFLSFAPMEYTPKRPFCPVWTEFQYRWGELYITPDLMITTQKNWPFTAEMCKLLICWYSERETMALRVIKANGLHSISEWSSCFQVLDNQAELAYQSIICGFSSDEDFHDWLNHHPVNDIIDLRKSSLLRYMTHRETILQTVLEYVNSKLTTVAGGQPSV